HSHLDSFPTRRSSDLAAKRDGIMLHRAFDIPQTQFDFPTLLIEPGDILCRILIGRQRGQNCLYSSAPHSITRLPDFPVFGEHRRSEEHTSESSHVKIS